MSGKSSSTSTLTKPADVDMTNPNNNPLLASMLQANNSLGQTLEAIMVPTLKGFVSSVIANQQRDAQESMQRIAGLGLFTRCKFVPKKAGIMPCTSIVARGSNYCQKHKYRCEIEERLVEESRKRKRAEERYMERGGQQEDLENDDPSMLLTKKRRTKAPTIESPLNHSSPVKPSPMKITSPPPQPMPNTRTDVVQSPGSELANNIQGLTVTTPAQPMSDDDYEDAGDE